MVPTVLEPGRTLRVTGGRLERHFRLSRALTPKSVRHRVDDVVDPDANAKSGELFVIARLVGPLPGIAQIHVETDRHHQAALVVVDAAPVGIVTVLLVRPAAAEVLSAG